MVDEITAKKLVAQSGPMLLTEGLAARTWGNVSCRIDEERMAITPSGLSYDNMSPEDIVIYNMITGQWEGKWKPSSEKAVHTAAYSALNDIGFVIHTHQPYASAIGLAGFESLDIAAEEESALAGVGLADYALPGTKELAEKARRIFEKGNHIVLLARHGAVIAGKGKDETFERALLLEKVCQRACKGQPVDPIKYEEEKAKQLLATLEKKFQFISHSFAPAILACAIEGKPILAQLDDMAQMIGPRIAISGKEEKIIRKFTAGNEAVLVPGVGAMCNGPTEKDSKAMCLLIEKACICWLHTKALGVNKHLSWWDIKLMRRIYVKKYSKIAKS